MKREAYIAALCLLGACRAGADYQAPVVDAPAAWSREQPAAADAAQELERWWDALDAPELDRLIERALADNLDLGIAQTRVRRARAELAISSSQRWPSADVSAGYSRARRSQDATNGAPFFGERENDLFDVGFDAVWEVDVFGGAAREVEASRAGLEATEELARDVRVSLIAEVARNYVELRGLEQRLALARSSIDTQRSTAEIVRSRARAGLASDLDLSRADAQVSASESVVPAFEAAIQARIHALGLLVGDEPRALAGELLATAPPIPAARAALALGQPLELLARRPDVRRAERECARANALVGVAEADRWPRVSIGASFGWLANQAGDLFQASSTAASLNPFVSLPVFDAGRRRAQVEAASADQEAALLAYRQAVLAAWGEVENALAALGGETARRRSLATSVESLQRASQLARTQYTSGLVDFLAVVDVQRALFAAQDELAQSETALSLDFVALAKALGGGWEASTSESSIAAGAETSPGALR